MSDEFDDDFDIKDVIPDPPITAPDEVDRLWLATLQKITETAAIMSDAGEWRNLLLPTQGALVTRLKIFAEGLESVHRQRQLEL